MKHAVILFDERDMQVAERLEKSLALMQRNGILKTYSSLHIMPGMHVQTTIDAYIEKSDVTLIVLSMDLSHDLIFKMIDRHHEQKTELLVVYSNFVEDALIEELQIHQITITPIMPIGAHPNKDVAYRKISNTVRKFLKKDHTNPQPISASKQKRLLVLLAARRNLQAD